LRLCGVSSIKAKTTDVGVWPLRFVSQGDLQDCAGFEFGAVAEKKIRGAFYGQLRVRGANCPTRIFLVRDQVRWAIARLGIIGLCRFELERRELVRFFR